MFLLALLFHKKIGEYPEPLEPVRNKRKELIEVLIVWIIFFLVLTYIMVSAFYIPFLPYPGFAIGKDINISLNLVLSFFIPLIFLRIWKKGKDRENFMFNQPQDTKSTVYFILVFLIYGTITFFIAGSNGETLLGLLWGIVTPSLSEELVSRSVITSKLERGYGQNIAWIIGGILFGLLHVPNDFFGYFWFIFGQNFLISLGALLVQIGSGFMFGIMFIKTRSIIPCVIGHYIVDFLPAILAILIPF